MKKLINFDVFTYEKYYTNLSTDSYMNQLENTSTSGGIDFSSEKLGEMLAYHGLQVHPSDIEHVAMELLLHRTYCTVTGDGDDAKQWVIIMRIF